MEEAFLAIAGIALPDAIVPIRKKVDTARALLERSSSEVALAVRMHEHEKVIRGAAGARVARRAVARPAPFLTFARGRLLPRG